MVTIVVGMAVVIIAKCFTQLYKHAGLGLVVIVYHIPLGGGDFGGSGGLFFGQWQWWCWGSGVGYVEGVLVCCGFEVKI